MGMETEPVPVSKAALWTGRVISALPVLMLLMSAAMKLAKVPVAIKGFEELGYPASLALCLGSWTSPARSSTQFRAPPSWVRFW